MRINWERIAWAVAVVLAAALGIQIPPIGQPPIIVQPPEQPATPIPIPPSPEPPVPQPSKDPQATILRLRFGNAGCSGVIIGPTINNNTQQGLTAAHCVNRVGQTGTATTKTGKSYKITVLKIDRRSDCALLAISTSEILPFAKLAVEAPKPGTKIWHSGYGVHKPGNVERGQVTGGENSYGQIRMNLSASSGDSGGPIFREDTGEVVSVVCCGSGRNLYGASPGSLTRLVGAQSFVRSE